METKKFHISDVLSITTPLLVSTRHMDGIYDILGFMTEGSPFTIQLPRISRICEPYLKKQFPILDSPEMRFAVGELERTIKALTSGEERKKFLLEWLSKLTSGNYGFLVPEMLDVEKLPSDTCKSVYA